MSSKLLAFAASLLIAGGAVAQTGQVDIKSAWARATPGKAENGAAYLTIVSPVADRLTAVSTPEAKTADLHNMTMEDGVMKMRPLTAIDLPAGQPITLKPGGMHIMLMGLAKPLKQGDTFPMTLSFEKAGTKEVTVAVEGPGAMSPQAGGPSKAPSGDMPMGNMPMKH
jgi:copper(I)-binding protein